MATSGQKVPTPTEEQGMLSQERLIEKYKSALGIAQKAKNARDEAIKTNKLLQDENEQLKEKVSTLEKQYKTVEEMLAALTNQKLKLSMEIDDLKKEKKIVFEELKSKENIENEVENYRSQYKKLLKENEELISSTETNISRMKKEHDELKRNNDTLKQVCNNIQFEKSELANNLEANLKKISQNEENQNVLNTILSKKYNMVVDEFTKWAQIIDSEEDTFAKFQELQMENEAMKSEKDKLNSSIIALTKDKENSEQEIVELNGRLKKICLDLDNANADRDKMLSNLENVSLETKRLIENSERLTQELGMLKEEKAFMEHMINVVNNEKVYLNKIIEEKETCIQQLTSELKKCQQLEGENGAGIDIFNGAMIRNTNCTHILKSEAIVFVKEESLDKERSVNVELHSLQEDIQAFSAEIERYKVILKESEANLQEALKTISEKEDLIESQRCSIVELKSRVSQMECFQGVVADILLETKSQLVVALEELELIVRLKDSLKHDCELKDEEFFVACLKLEKKEHFIKDVIEGIEGLRFELNSIHKIDSLDEEFDPETSNPEVYIMGLKKCLDAVTSKMYHRYKEEIENLKEIINEYQENNEALAIDNDKLSKQTKDLLNEQANYDNSLVQKLKTFKENLLYQLKEKQAVITKYETEVTLLKEEITEKINTNKRIEEEKYDLKCKYDKLVSENSMQIMKLSEKASELEIQYEELISNLNAKNKIITNLEDEINNLQNFISNLENTSANFEKRNSEFSDAIITLSSDLEKENKELQNLILNMNSELFVNMDESPFDNSVDNPDIKKVFIKLKLHKSLVLCVLKEFERLKLKIEHKDVENEKTKSELSQIIEDNCRLSAEVMILTKDINELTDNFADLKKWAKTLIEICKKKKFMLRSEELEGMLPELLPHDLKKDFENIKILDDKELDSTTNINIEEQQNKLLGLESLLKEKETVIETEIGKRDSVINSLKVEIKSLKDRVSHISNLNDSLNSDLSNFKDNLERLRCEYSDEKDFLLDRINQLQSELQDCKELLNFKSLELRENNRIWAGRFSSLKVALIGLNKTRKEIKNHFQSVEASFNSFVDQIKEPLQEKVDLVVQNAVAISKAELIREMHQMNQALKERGEAISKLEFTITECHTKMKQIASVSEKLQSELVQAKTELHLGEDTLKEKDQIIKQLESEIEQMKESSVTDNDGLSSSTISKAEEHSRLKDVEESFEDRYMKMKLIAVKLKKRAADIGQTLELERAKAANEMAELQEKISSMSISVKNAQKIQGLFDESLDERDKLMKENTNLKNTLEEFKNIEQALNNKISNLESNNQSIPVMKKHIDSLNAVIKESKSELQRLQIEIKAECIKYDEVKKNASKLEVTVQELTCQLEQAKQQGKSNSVLELEMKNYEKIIADLSSQLNIERALTKSLRSENEALSNVKIGLEEQISILEKQISVEEQRNIDIQDQLTIYQGRIEEKKGQIEALNNSIGEVKKHLSNEKSKNEAVTLEMSAISSEFSKKEMAMMSKISSLQDQARSLETSLLSTKQELATAKHEIDHLNEEYESYKLRAQTILAKKKGNLVTHTEKEAKEECDHLKRECAALEERLDACMSEIDTLNTRFSSLKLEKARGEKRYEEVRFALQQKLTEHDALNTEFYNFKITNDMAVEQLKAELLKRKNEYQAELAYHKKIIDDLMIEFKQKEEDAVSREKSDNAFSSFTESIILPSSEREDGEGSESVPSPKMRRHSAVVPLDVLLNSPDESKVSMLQEQVDKLQKDLGCSEVRARHLSSLLSEAEKDSARNLHQNKVLKEEVRRLERALERQPHIANTEYLKNVVFKFVTLPNGDERSRLVPVLDTLLKLSPEETNKLCSVTKGDGQAGWSSYLQSWTGL